jgi:hypothetical protein
VVYGFQLAAAIRLILDPADLSAIGDEAIILIILFAMGIDRAWELIGASSPRLGRALADALNRQGAE